MGCQFFVFGILLINLDHGYIWSRHRNFNRPLILFCATNTSKTNYICTTTQVFAHLMIKYTLKILLLFFPQLTITFFYTKCTIVLLSSICLEFIKLKA